jgi:lipopolysaccharide transport system ATP-binding protein
MEIISVENISKQYQLQTIGTGTLSHDLNRWWHKLRGKEDPYLTIGEENNRNTKGKSDFVWALENINFKVNQGEIVGIIGRNGAGKSTLLKILSSITSPSKGRIVMKGRLAALLEVGTGFHPELTGRENVFINGAIMGMRKHEIAKKFDEIVAFAGVERYIDTPVKRYSSGMTVRLGFAVAAHLEPEILVIDEVLAVGDAEFQKKALGKMQDVSKNSGRTVLFVSHNMAAVKALCNRGIVLRNGKLEFDGLQTHAVKYYQNSHNTQSAYQFNEEKDNFIGNSLIQILSFEVNSLANENITISSGFEYKITFLNNKENINLDITFELKNNEETTIFHYGKIITDAMNSKKGIYQISSKIPGNIINSGTYKFSIIFGENQRYLLFKYEDIVQFEIMNEIAGSNSNILPGILRIPFDYDVTLLETKI